jgi:ElaB/YqjD/DUF883 family membrane-anchored ribosome-binding protein
VTHLDDKRRAQEQAKTILTKCDELLESSSSTTTNSASSSRERLDQYLACYQTQVEAVLDTKAQEHDFESTLRKTMATQFSQYACHPHTNVSSSSELVNRTWHYTNPVNTNQKKVYQIQLLHEHDDHSYIVQLPNFITASECRAMRQAQKQQQAIAAQEQPDSSSTAATGRLAVSIPWSMVQQQPPTQHSLYLQSFTEKMYSLGQTLLEEPQLSWSSSPPSRSANHDLLTWQTTEPYYVKEQELILAALDQKQEVQAQQEEDTPTAVVQETSQTCSGGNTTTMTTTDEGTVSEECAAATSAVVNDTTLAATTESSSGHHHLNHRIAPLVSGSIEPLSVVIDDIERIGSLFIFCPLEQDDDDGRQGGGDKGMTRTTTTDKDSTATSTSSMVLDGSAIVEDPDNDVDYFVVSGGGSGALRFPYADVHVNPKPYLVVFATHPTKEHALPPHEGFTKEYHICPNAQIMTHAFYQP